MKKNKTNSSFFMVQHFCEEIFQSLEEEAFNLKNGAKLFESSSCHPREHLLHPPVRHPDWFKIHFFSSPSWLSEALRSRTWPSLQEHCPLHQGAGWGEPLPLLSTSLSAALPGNRSGHCYEDTNKTLAASCKIQPIERTVSPAIF